MEPQCSKIFGIGLARTGTTSMHRAMLALGIRSAPSSAALIHGIDQDFLARYDAFFDNPIPFLFEQLDAAYPDARYLVTHRPLEPWLASMQWLFGPGLQRLSPTERRLGDEVHLHVYGTDIFDAKLLSKVHRDHYSFVREWMQGRPDVLWLEQAEGFTWPPLCEFLGVPSPDQPFPHLNASHPASRVRATGARIRTRWRR